MSVLLFFDSLTDSSRVELSYSVFVLFSFNPEQQQLKHELHPQKQAQTNEKT